MEALRQVASALLGLVAPLAVPGALFVWARAIARRRGDTPLWRRARWLPVLGFAASLLGLLASVATIAIAFATIGSVDAESRATALARGIATGMNVGALGLALALALYALSFALSLYGTLTARR